MPVVDETVDREPAGGLRRGDVDRHLAIGRAVDAKPDVAAPQENRHAVEPRAVDTLPTRTSVDDGAPPPESETRGAVGEVATEADGRKLPIVTGRFVRNDGTPWVSTVVTARSWFVPGAHHTTLGESMITDATGRFRMGVRVPRAHDERRGFHLRIDSRAEGDDDAIRVEDVFVVASETTRDPRLQGITINATSTRVAIKVVDESSQPIARATVHVVGDGRGGEARSDTSGVAVLRGRELPFDAEVDAFGSRATKLFGVDREVVLRRGIPVVLVSSMPAHGTEPRYDLGLRLHPCDAERRTGPMLWPDTTPLDRLFFDGSGEMRFDLPEPGRYCVDVFVFVHGSDNVGRGGTIGPDPSLAIEVQESTVGQRIRVEIPEERVRAMLERLGG